jgi:hypothetical protein
MSRLFSTFALLCLLIACQQPDTDVATNPPTLLLTDTYSISDTEVESSLTLSVADRQVSEVGVVWADRPNPTTSNARQSLTDVANQTQFFIRIPGLRQGQTLYVRAYYVRGGETLYSTAELTLTHRFNGTNWLRLPSPKLEPERYISPDGVTFTGNNGGITFNAVNRTTEYAKPTSYFPGFEGWDPSFFRSVESRDAPMRFGMFRAGFTTPGGRRGTLVGGGYYKQPTGDRFYLKEIKVDGFDGYKWDPPYPGADVPTSSFGLGTYGYVLENKANGKLWRFDPLALTWEAVANVPVAKEGRFVSFGFSDRAFMLAEPANRADALAGLYEFMPTKNEWQLRKPFPGENRRWGVAFVAGTRLYYGAGQSAGTLRPLRDLWAYDPAADSWQRVADYPGSGTVNLVSFVVDRNIYLGFGQQVVPNAAQGEAFTDVFDFWRFRP